MEFHLEYKNKNHGAKNTSNRRNGYASKTVKSTYGNITIVIPHDWEGSFDPQAISKRSWNASCIENKVLSMMPKE